MLIYINRNKNLIFNNKLHYFLYTKLILRYHILQYTNEDLSRNRHDIL